jgi:NAD(P)-dependent dehydrogenase (short-subunit alcohol dehydrogenase family)
MAKVLVIGASRGVGLETVRAALRAGHSVRALARSVSSRGEGWPAAPNKSSPPAICTSSRIQLPAAISGSTHSIMAPRCRGRYSCPRIVLTGVYDIRQ